MKRNIYKKLLAWKNNLAHKPLILEGARQVGKTYIVKKFGKSEYEKFAYFNFDENKELIGIFDYDLKADRILLALSAEIGFKIDEKTLVFFDEIQVCGKAITSLKYFCEDRKDINIIAAGSLLGLNYSDGTGFPVGKVEFLKMYPLNFNEFLTANGEDLLVDAILKRDYKLISLMKEKLENYFRIYCFVGGMPEVVQSFIDNHDLNEAVKIQKDILRSYDIDFSKHTKNGKLEKIRQIWNSIPSQLSKENKKFKYSDIKKSSRAKDYEDAIEFLRSAGIIYIVKNIKKFRMPLKAYEDYYKFKIYMLDVGLLSNLNHVDSKIVNLKKEVFTEYKGSIAEQYVLSQLFTNGTEDVFYYSDETSRSEIDFVVERDNKIIPIEVKAGVNLKAKSLNNVIKSNDIMHAIRYSLADYKKNEIIEDIPVYAICDTE